MRNVKGLITTASALRRSTPRRRLRRRRSSLVALLFAAAAALGVAAPTTVSSAVQLRSDNTSASHGRAHAQHTRQLLLFTRQICFTDEDPCWELVVSDAADEHETVVAGPYPRTVWDDHFIANWAPDGRSLIFMADLGSGQAIWQVETDGSHLHKVFAPPNDGTGLDDGPAFTPDGRHIIFTRCCPPVSGYALWSITAHGDNLTQVTSEAVPAGVDGPSDNLPQVSPNGREVAYHRNNVDPTLGAEGNRISVAPLRTGTYTDLTDPALDDQIPNWSNNGRKIVFQTIDGNVARVDRNGSHRTQLTFDGGSRNPSYTPDGDIVFSQADDGGNRDLWIMRPDGSNPRVIRATEDLERFPHIIELHSH